MFHQVLGKDLASFDDGRRFVGAEAGHADGFQRVHRAQNKGVIWSNHCKINGILLGKLHDTVKLFRADVYTSSILGNTAVTRQGKNFRDGLVFLQAFDDGVLSSATADYHEFHLSPRFLSMVE